MKHFTYELHAFKELDLPMVFDFYEMNPSFYQVPHHWHIDIELLYFTKGSSEISINGDCFFANAGDVIIFNSSNIHSIKLLSEECSYYCLIMDHKFCKELGFNITDTIFSNKTKDTEIINIFHIMIRESSKQNLHWKKAIRALGITMIILLHRNQIVHSNKNSFTHTKMDLVKKSIDYINKNISNNFSLDDISYELSISKYYFCRIFKEITGQTLKEYLLAVRCVHARTLLQKGTINIIECSQMCGFNNPSYFAKCYKSHFGYLPSNEFKILP